MGVQCSHHNMVCANADKVPFNVVAQVKKLYNAYAFGVKSLMRVPHMILHAVACIAFSCQRNEVITEEVQLPKCVRLSLLTDRRRPEDEEDSPPFLTNGTPQDDTALDPPHGAQMREIMLRDDSRL